MQGGRQALHRARLLSVAGAPPAQRAPAAAPPAPCCRRIVSSPLGSSSRVHAEVRLIPQERGPSVAVPHSPRGPFPPALLRDRCRAPAALWPPPGSPSAGPSCVSKVQVAWEPARSDGGRPGGPALSPLDPRATGARGRGQGDRETGVYLHFTRLRSDDRHLTQASETGFGTAQVFEGTFPPVSVVNSQCGSGDAV